MGGSHALLWDLLLAKLEPHCFYLLPFFCMLVLRATAAAAGKLFVCLVLIYCVIDHDVSLKAVFS